MLLFGRSAIGWHVDCLLWWGALLAAVALLYRRELSSRLSVVALAIFAIDDSHWMPIVWSAARNGLVATMPAVLGLCAHLRWRREGWRAGAVLGPLGLGVGLAGGEAAVGVFGYVAAYELLDGARAPAARRLMAFLPYVPLFAVYAIVRAAASAGIRGSASYVDPTSDPVSFAAAAIGRVPALAGNLVFNLPSELWAIDLRVRPLLVAVGVAAIVLVALWLRAALGELEDEDARSLRWLGAGALLALLPGAGAMTGERVLLPASVGAAAVFSVLVRDGIQRWRRLKGRAGRRMLIGAGLVAVALPNVVLAGPLLVGKTLLWKVLADGARDTVCAAPLDGRGPARAIVAWAPDPPLAGFGGAIRWYHCRGNIVSWTVMSMSPYPQTLSRTSPTSLTLTALERPLLDGEWEVLFRSPRIPLHEGDTVTQDGGLRITVRAVERGRPSRVVFDFPKPIEESEYRLLVWREGRFDRLALPIGQSIRLGRDAR
jgi:hypothetical protein